jgi:hypothetical protein
VLGRTLAGQAYPDDDGAPDPRVRAALDDYAAGRASEHAVLTALAACRLLVPVVARLTAEESPGPGGLRREKSSEMALPTLIGADGRAALPAFTSMEALTCWRVDARPVPVPAAMVWQSAAQQASEVVIDVAGPVPFAVDGARLAALARGAPVPLPHEDPDMVALVRGVLAAEPAIAAFQLLPGGHGTDLTLCLVPGPAVTPVQVRDAVERVSASVMARAEGRVRRGIEIALTTPEGSASSDPATPPSGSGAPLPGTAAGGNGGDGVK